MGQPRRWSNSFFFAPSRKAAISERVNVRTVPCLFLLLSRPASWSGLGDPVVGVQFRTGQGHVADVDADFRPRLPGGLGVLHRGVPAQVEAADKREQTVTGGRQLEGSSRRMSRLTPTTRSKAWIARGAPAGRSAALGGAGEVVFLRHGHETAQLPRTRAGHERLTPCSVCPHCRVR